MILPLSLEQESFVGLDPVTAPNVALTHRVSGPLRIEALQAAAVLLLQRHEGLRFRLTDAGQRIAEPGEVEIKPEAATAAQALERADSTHRMPLDLREEGPVRFGLYRIGPTDHVLTTTVHPAALDAWGDGIVVRELWALYEAVQRGREASLRPLPLSFSEHVRRQHASGPALPVALRDRHASRLADPLDLPWQHTARPSALVARQAFGIEPAAILAIGRVARQICVTTSAIFLAAFQLALGLMAHAEAGSMSSIYFGRDTPGTMGMAAAFARRVPLRFVMRSADPLADFVQEAMQGWAVAVGESGPPYSSARLRREIGGRLDALEPVFNLRVAADDTDQEAGAGPAESALQVDWIAGPASRPVPMWSQFGQAALFALVTLDGEAAVTAVYDPREVSEPTAQAIFDNYRRIISLISDGDVRVTIGQLLASSRQSSASPGQR